VLVSTPIGNLGDVSPRARAVLAASDLVLCEAPVTPGGC
jgi:16S rRNA C1402 (ribose-2'-O) methylase RsmI